MNKRKLCNTRQTREVEEWKEEEFRPSDFYYNGSFCHLSSVPHEHWPVPGVPEELEMKYDLVPGGPTTVVGGKRIKVCINPVIKLGFRNDAKWYVDLKF